VRGSIDRTPCGSTVSSIKKRRCLIPADGFYEWVKNGKTKTPFCFTLADDALFAFAGLWDFVAKPGRQTIETCTIITTTQNALCADVHDRMPVILPNDAYDLRLDPGLQKTTMCATCLNRSIRH
jgi:putative SOS response-associated peptidase YedK